MTLTIETLVQEFIKDMTEMRDEDHDLMVQKWVKFTRQVQPDIYSIALNDETRDVRFVEIVAREGVRSAHEVFPETVVRTEYRAGVR